MYEDCFHYIFPYGGFITMAKSKNKKATTVTDTKKAEEPQAATPAAPAADPAPAAPKPAAAPAPAAKEPAPAPTMRQETDNKIRSETDTKVKAPAPAKIRQETDNKIADTLVDPVLRAAQEDLTMKFNRYAEAMASGRPIENEKVGANHQVSLWRLIDSTLRQTGQQFTASFTTLLALIDSQTRNRGVLDARLRYRFFGALPLGRDEASAFESILSALVTVADPKSRVLALKQVDFQKAFRNYPDKTALARVVDYFNL